MTEKKTVHDRVLTHIKEQKVTPKPKWRFIARNTLLWTTGVAAVAIGSIACSVMITLIVHHDWHLLLEGGKGMPLIIMRSLPYFWLLLLVLFIAIAHWNLRHTKKGYRYNIATIVVVLVAASVAGGGALQVAKIGTAVDLLLEEQAPFYGKMLSPRHRTWTEPEEGRMGGIIIEIIDEDEMYIEDMYDEKWYVITESIIVMPTAEYEEEAYIRAIGELASEQEFHAEQLHVVPAERPFGLKGFFHKHMKNGKHKGDSERHE